MKRILPMFALFAFGLASADSSPASQVRNVPAFHGVEIAGVLEVEVTVGKPASVKITGDADLLDKVTTTVKDGVLVLDTERDLDRSSKHRKRRLGAIVTAPDLTSLALPGTGALNVTGIANDKLSIAVPGTGAVSVTGTTGSLRVSVDGTGKVKLKDLTARAASVDISGTGQVSLHASESFEAKISGTGAVEVHGNPARIRKSVTGTGAIHMR